MNTILIPRFPHSSSDEKRFAELRWLIAGAEARGDIDQAGTYFLERMTIQRRMNDAAEQQAVGKVIR